MKNREIIILSEQQAKKKKHHVSYDTIIGMESAFRENKAVTSVNLKPLFYKINRLSYKLFKKGIKDKSVLLKTKPDAVYLYIAMGLGDLRRNCETLHWLSVKKKRKIAVYCFDTWEPEYPEWDLLFQYIQPEYLFLAFYQSVEYFKRKFDKTFLCPQSADYKIFHDYGAEKERMFMQMGRRTETIHQMILKYLKNHNIGDTPENYIYEREKGKIIFPETVTLAKEINRSKYFVCAPQSLEWRKKTGNISDVTARFYEAFACKTLIIGYKPEIIYDKLFSPDSMIELKEDGSDFNEKIEYFENHPLEYEKLLEKNYQMFLENHTWSKRLEFILGVIN